MLTHAEIIVRAGTPDQIADWRGVSVHTVRSWIARDKIPDEHWAAFADKKHATLKELAEYSAAKPRPAKKQAA